VSSLPLSLLSHPSNRCLDITNTIINPFNGDTGSFPEDMYKTCDSSATNNALARITLTDEDIANGWAALQVVGAGGLWELALSIDEHPMYVFAVEGQYVSASNPVHVLNASYYS
jgi:hypothetical protein